MIMYAMPDTFDVRHDIFSLRDFLLAEISTANLISKGPV